MADRVDLAVVGGGPAGYATALYAASAGLRVALVERDEVGGTCLHRGCIPAKALLESAHVNHVVGRAAEHGIGVDGPTLDLAATQARKQAIVDRLFGGLTSLLDGRGVDVLAGQGRLLDGRRVEVTGSDGSSTTIDADGVVVATGSSPRLLPGLEVDGRVVVTSDELLRLDRVPERAAVVGGGAIGCEFASLLADLGTEVTVLEALPSILPGCDADVVKALVRAWKKRGIAVRTGVSVVGHVPGGDGTSLQIEGDEPLGVDLVVVAIGRRPVTDGAGLVEAGIGVDDRGFVEVDGRCRTAVDGVWAVGDVIDTPQLAHVGFAEGMLAVRDHLGEEPLPIDYGRVPWGIYCRPEVAFAGLTEARAVDAGLDVVCHQHRFIGNGRALVLGEPDGLVKVVAERGPDGAAGRLLGVHLVGPWVTEQLGAGYLAVNWEATVDDLAPYVQPHPSLSEVFGEAVLALTGRSLH